MFVAIISVDYRRCQFCGLKQGNLSVLSRRQQSYKSCQQLKVTLQGRTNMTLTAIIFDGYSLTGLSGSWAISTRKSVIFVSSCQSSTILGCQHQLFTSLKKVTDSRSKFNTLWSTWNGVYCITRTIVGLCVPPVTQVRAMKKVIEIIIGWGIIIFTLLLHSLLHAKYFVLISHQSLSPSHIMRSIYNYTCVFLMYTMMCNCATTQQPNMDLANWCILTSKCKKAQFVYLGRLYFEKIMCVKVMYFLPNMGVTYGYNYQFGTIPNLEWDAGHKETSTLIWNRPWKNDTINHTVLQKP